MGYKGRGNYIGTDSSYVASRLSNSFPGIWDRAGQLFYGKTDSWAFPGTVTYAQVSVASSSYVLFNGDSTTFILSSSAPTLGDGAASWSVGVANSGSSYRRDSPTALDYAFVVPTSPFPVSIVSSSGGNYVIEMAGGGGNGGGDSVGGGGGGGYTVWSGAIPSSTTSATAKVGSNGGDPGGTSSISMPVFSLTANSGNPGGQGGCSTNGPGGSGGSASGGNVVNNPGSTGGQGSTACGGCSSGGGAGGSGSYSSQYYPNGATLNTFPDPWGSGYGGHCGNAVYRYFGGGGGQAGGDNAGGQGGGYGIIRITFRGGL